MKEENVILALIGVGALWFWYSQRNANPGVFAPIVPSNTGTGLLPKTVSANGIAFIKSQEGFTATPAPDVGGGQVIGYGHTIEPGETYSNLTKLQASNLLDQDLIPIENAINSDVTAPINQNQFDALADFIYNVGIGAFQSSTLLSDLNGENYSNASAQFASWVQSANGPLQALATRRAAEQQLFNA